MTSSINNNNLILLVTKYIELGYLIAAYTYNLFINEHALEKLKLKYWNNNWFLYALIFDLVGYRYKQIDKINLKKA